MARTRGDGRSKKQLKIHINNLDAELAARRQELTRATEELREKTALYERRIAELRRLADEKVDYRAQIVNHALDLPPELRLKLETNSLVIVTFDGINASGKSTLIETLNYALTNSGVKYGIVKESVAVDPLAEEKRREARRIERTKQRELLIGAYVSAGRVAGLQRLLGKLTESDGILAFDRYYVTTLAYQTGVVGLDLNAAIGKIAGTYFLPHKSVILLCDPQVARARETDPTRTGRVPDSADDLEKRARGFYDVAQHIPRGHIIDTSAKTQEEVAVEVVEEVLGPYLKNGNTTGAVTDKLRERYRSRDPIKG